MRIIEAYGFALRPRPLRNWGAPLALGPTGQFFAAPPLERAWGNRRPAFIGVPAQARVALS
jgi:hypothetical protein